MEPSKIVYHNQSGIVRLLVLAVIVAVTAGGFCWVKYHKNINSFDTCQKSGNPVQLSYPQVCVTKDGKHFVQSLTK